MNPKIPFSKNWNNKLMCDSFTTFRLWEQRKYEYYLGHQSDLFDVILKKKFFRTAKLIRVETMDLRTAADLYSYLDANMTQSQFYELMKKMYSRKSEWKDWETKLIFLIFGEAGKL